MKKVFSILTLLLIAISSFGQFADTAAVNAYIRTNIRDIRPEKVTAEKIRIALLGVSKFTGGSGGVTYTPGAGVKIFGSTVSLADTVMGTGTKLFWLTSKKAFRAGAVDGSGGNNWEPTTVGNYTAAFGLNTNSTQDYSFAVGQNTTASGYHSFAAGILTNAGGNRAAAFGEGTTASGFGSFVAGISTMATQGGGFAFGNNTRALGGYAGAIGNGTYAKAAGGFSIGEFNTNTDVPDYSGTDRMFQIGIGTDDINRDNAGIVFRSGKWQLNKYGIGTFTGTPTRSLNVDASGNIIEGASVNNLLSVIDTKAPIRFNIGDFVAKLKNRTTNSDSLITLLFWGNSIFGRLYNAEMSEGSNTIYAPPAMDRQNIARRILDSFQLKGSNLKYYPAKNLTGFTTRSTGGSYPADNSFMTLSGTWSNWANNDFTYFRETTTNGDFITFQLDSGFTHASLIAQRQENAPDIVNVTVSVNGGAYVLPSAAGLAGSDVINLLRPAHIYGGMLQRFYRVNYTGLVSANTYKFKFTKNSTYALRNFSVWGMEAWKTKSLRVINTGRGSHTMQLLNEYINDDILSTNYKADAAFFEIPMLNEVVVGDSVLTQKFLDSVLLQIKNNGIPTVIIVPHPSGLETPNYINYIRFARSYSAKYGFETIDMYDNWQAASWTADNIHLNDGGVTQYYNRISTTLNNGYVPKITVIDPAQLIVNSTSLQAGANFNIAGNGVIGTKLKIGNPSDSYSNLSVAGGIQASGVNVLGSADHYPGNGGALVLEGLPGTGQSSVKTVVNGSGAPGPLLLNPDGGVVRIGIGAAGNARAALQIESTTGGLLIPRMTTTQQNALSSPPDGLKIYNTTTRKEMVYDTSTHQFNPVIIANYLGRVGLNTSPDVSHDLKTNSDILVNRLTVGTGGGNDQSNAVLGTDAFVSNTTGQAGIAFGNGAGFNNTTGQHNSYIGFLSGFYNQTGSDNVGIGPQSFFYSKGSSNNIVGAFSGMLKPGGDSVHLTFYNRCNLFGRGIKMPADSLVNVNAFGDSVLTHGSYTTTLANTLNTDTYNNGIFHTSNVPAANDSTDAVPTTAYLQRALASATNISITVTPTGTTGAQTINKLGGFVNFAAGATTLTVTNSLVTSNTIVRAQIQSNDATAKTCVAVPVTGGFTIYLNAAATAETRVSFEITQTY